MRLKVCVINDYYNGFVRNVIKNLLPNGGGLDSTIDVENIKITFIEYDPAKVASCDYDYVVIINKSNSDIKVRAKRVIALQQEPYIKESKQYGIPFKNEWAKNPAYYSFCDIVLAFNDELFADKHLISNNPKTFVYNNTTFIKHHPALYFMFGDISFKNLCDLKPPHKTKQISCIASFDKKAFYGHLDRIKFVNFLKQSKIGDKIDFFGNKTPNELKEKKDGILPYKYTIAIENNAQDDYVSEKIMDAYLGYSIPIYFGASNVDTYFPKGSFIKIDIYNPESAIKTIQAILESSFYEEHFDALLEARKKVLYEYSMFISLSKEIIKDYKIHHSTPIHCINIKQYKRSISDSIKRWAFLVYYACKNFLTNGERKSRLKDLTSR